VTSAEVQALLYERTGEGGPCGRACFDARHEDCGWLLDSDKLCRCRCHPRIGDRGYEW
jgi:hypothetical protein